MNLFRRAFVAIVSMASLAAMPLVAQTPPSAGETSAYTGLLAAAHAGDVAAIERLARVPGTTLEVRDGNGRTPLHVATFARQRGAVEALLNAGAAPDLLDNDRYDAVTIASINAVQ